MPSFAAVDHTFYNAAQVPVVSAPVAASTITMSQSAKNLHLNPAGTLATLKILLPPQPSPGFEATLVSSQTVTTLTLHDASDAAITGAPTTMVINTMIRMRYVSAALGWVWIH